MAEDDKPGHAKPGDHKPGHDEDESSVIGRWAKRKQDARLRQGEAAATPPGQSRANAEPGSDSVAPRRDGEGLDPDTLPDPDKLTVDADWSVYMRQGVPEVLQRRALRRLWRLNPVFGHLDRLNDYDDDFTDAATVVQGLKTLYQVGKGMVVEERSMDAEAPGPDSPAAEAGDGPDLERPSPPVGEDDTAADSPAADSPASGTMARDPASPQALPDVGGAIPADHQGADHGADHGADPTRPTDTAAVEPAEIHTVKGKTTARARRLPANAATRRWGRFST